jgi:hypothetical protein
LKHIGEGITCVHVDESRVYPWPPSHWESV